MTNKKMKVGDRVEVVDDGESLVKPGRRGKVVCFDLDLVGVELDEEFLYGHDCLGHAKDGYGWYFCPKELKVIEED